MDLKQAGMMKLDTQLIIAVWHWDRAPTHTLKGDHDRWQTDRGTSFVRTSCINNSQGHERLVDLAKTYMHPEGAVLLLLHESAPHYFNREIAKEIGKRLELPSSRFRIRVFGNAKGPIYVMNSRLGILSSHGDFSTSYYDPGPDGNLVKKPSGLILDGPAHLLNHNHIDHLWNCYWNTPFLVLYNLAEHFQYWSMGFHTQLEKPPKKLKEYILLDTGLWHKLIQFADREGLGTDQNLLKACAEYRADNHALHLKACKQEKLAHEMMDISRYIAAVLDESADPSKKDADHIEHIYASLHDIAAAMPTEML